MLSILFKTAKDTKLNVLQMPRAGAWINVVNPSEQEIHRLVNEFKMEEGLVRDAIDPFEVPRLEIDDKTIYVFTRIPYRQADDTDRVTTDSLLIAITPEYLITISRKDLPFLNVLFDNKINFQTTQKAKMLVQIFHQINSAYQQFITKISKQVRGMMYQIENISNSDIVRFVRFEEVLNDFLSALTATNTVLNNLLTRRAIDFFEEDKDLIEDMFLSNGQLIETAKGNLKNIVNIREAYTTIMTQDLNRIIKILTVLTIILNVPVLLASLYGMNVHLPGAQLGFAFWWIIILSGAISVLLMIFFIKNRWLK